MLVSGVRRSWDTADSKVLRMRSPSIATWVCCATSTKCTRSSASAIWLAQASNSRRSSGTRKRCGARSCSTSTPRARTGAHRGTYKPGAADKVSVPCPAIWPCSMLQRPTLGSIGPSLPRTTYNCSSLSGSSNPAWASNTPDRVDRAISETCSCVSAPDRSRASRARAPARRSRSAATRASCRSRAISWPQTSATPSIRLKVNRYCVSLTLKELRGGTK